MKQTARALMVVALCCAYGAWTMQSTLLDVHGFHLFPVALVAVAMHMVRVPGRHLVAGAGWTATAATLMLTGIAPLAAILYGAAAALSGYVSVRLLQSRERVLPLASENDWARVVVASLTGALAFSAAAAISSAGEPADEARSLVAAAFVNAFASFLVWLPLVVRTPRFPALARPVERTVQWTLLVLVTVLVFSASSSPPFVYLVFALLCWSALRLSLIETLTQLLVVKALATTMYSHGLGPYAPEATLPHELQVAFLQLFLITCSLSVVALSLSSSRTRAETRREATARAENVASQRLHTVVEELEAERTLVEQMREVDKVKDALVSTVSHELRTPITNIIGYSEMLEDGDYGSLSPSQSEAMTKIEDNSRRLLGLIDDLLTLSRMRSAQIELTCTSIDLVLAARAAEEAILTRLASADMSMETDLPRTNVVVEADGEKIERVLVNLLSNAVKFTPAGGTVTLRLTTEDGWAVFEVSDTGYGISAADQERLFSQFFRTSAAERRHIPGTGLGLSIVRSIVEAHGGHVDVDSVVDVGTSFRVHLPLEAPPAPTRAGLAR